MANNDAELRIGGNIDELKAATEKATAEVKRMADQMQSSLGSLNSAFQKIHGTFMAFTAVLAGGSAFKGVISASAEWTGQTTGLAKALGITTEQASVMNVAMTRIGLGSDVVIGASQKLAKQIHTNSQAFEVLGVKVKDSGGQYRSAGELMGEVNQKLAEIKNPIEQAIAGQQVYGKSWAEIRPILRLTSEELKRSEERAKQLHLIVGPEGAAQTKQYKEQMKDLNLVGKSLEVQFGTAVMPVFVKMGAWLGKEGPAMGEIFGRVLETVAAAAQTVWVTFEAVGNTIAGVAAAASAALHGNFAGAKEILGDMVAKNKEAAQKIKDIWAHAYDRPAPSKSSTPDYSDSPTYNFGKEGDGKSAADKSRMSAWETELSQAKVFYQKQYELREYSKEQERDYWQSILNNVKMTGAERLAVTKKISEVELEILKKQVQQKRALDAEAINAREKVAEDGLKMEELLSQREYELGNITKMEQLALLQQYENRRFEIQQEAQAARINAMRADPNMDPVALQKLLDQMGDIQRRHAMTVVKLQTDSAMETKAKWEQALGPIRSAFEKSVTGMIQGTLTLHKAMSNIFQSIFAESVSMTVGIATKWAAMELAKTAATQKNTTIRTVLEKMGLVETAAATTATSATVATAKTAEAAVVVPAEAAKAAGGAASAVAAIPIVGPALAAGAFAATMAMVLGGLKSASQGYDIPSGVNPMTQLHQEEMVLPAQYANVIRDIAAGEGGGRGFSPTIQVHAMDSKDVVRALKQGGALHKALKDLGRNFTPTK